MLDQFEFSKMTSCAQILNVPVKSLMQFIKGRCRQTKALLKPYKERSER